MKKFIGILVFSLCFIHFLKAQDIIILKTGDEIKAKVLEITLDEIKYKTFNYLDGPTVTIYKSTVFMIKYENGTKDIFEEQKKVQTTEQQEDTELGDPKAMYEKGCNDAKISYTGNGPLWGTVGASWLGCAVPTGLITAIAVSSTPPAIENLHMDYKMMKNTNYVRGYSDQAFKIKKEKTWQGFGTMAAIQAVTLFILISLTSSD